VTEHELERAKHQIEAHFVLSKERTLDQAMLLGQIETLCGLEYVDSYLSRIAAVNSEGVADVCRRYLIEKNRTVAWMIPEAAQEDREAASGGQP
jgi:predicted Zn-dependent peptidase